MLNSKDLLLPTPFGAGKNFKLWNIFGNFPRRSNSAPQKKKITANQWGTFQRQVVTATPSIFQLKTHSSSKVCVCVIQVEAENGWGFPDGEVSSPANFKKPRPCSIQLSSGRRSHRGAEACERRRASYRRRLTSGSGLLTWPVSPPGSADQGKLLLRWLHDEDDDERKDDLLWRIT